jgi:Uma2 family endonuclease
MSERGDGTRREGGMTYADYLQLPDDGRRYQLVEGELIPMTSPSRRHQEISAQIHEQLGPEVRGRGLGKLYAAPFDVVLDDRTCVQPDILFVSRQRAAILGDANVTGAPDLCVEILSPGTASLDRVRKLNLYARAGVPHYWMVDPDAEVLEEYVLEGEFYRPRRLVPFGEPFRPTLFPDLELRISP